MNHDSQLYLSARRPGGQDDNDPPIASALSAAQSDPALRSWFDEQQRVDSALSEKLRQVQPPEGLKERILAGARISNASWRSWFGRKLWKNLRTSELIAAAALLLVLASAVAFRYFHNDSASPNWQIAGTTEIAKIEARERQVETSLGKMTEVRSWLASQVCPVPDGLPQPVRELPIMACATMRWKGQPMSIVCFSLENGKEVHLVTIDRKLLSVPPQERPPTFALINGYQTASWSQGSVSMMLAGRVERAELVRLFENANAAILPRRRLLALASQF